MKKQLVEAFYSLKTGKRTTNAYGKRYPEKVLTLSINPNFLRGKDVAITADGMPANLEAAKLAKAMLETHAAKLAARRAAAAAKKATAAAKSVGKKAPAKKTAKKTSRLVKRDRANGEFAKKSSRKKSVTTDIIKAPKPLMKAPLKKPAKKAEPKKPTPLM